MEVNQGALHPWQKNQCCHLNGMLGGQQTHTTGNEKTSATTDSKPPILQ